MAPNVLSKKDMTPSRLFAVSDLHLGYRANREIADRIKPVGPDDWLLIAGDVSERVSDLEWVLRLLTSRFARVVWVPGNHDLWTHASDPVALRGEERYLHLVDVCRRAGRARPDRPAVPALRLHVSHARHAFGRRKPGLRLRHRHRVRR